MEFDLLALGCELEIAHPNLQGFHNIKAIKLQIHLAILYLAEIENTTNQLLESNGIALHHLQEFASLPLDAAIFKQHLYRVGYQG